MIGKRVELDTATRMTTRADYSTRSRGQGSRPQTTPEIDPVAELKWIILGR